VETVEGNRKAAVSHEREVLTARDSLECCLVGFVEKPDEHEIPLTREKVRGINWRRVALSLMDFTRRKIKLKSQMVMAIGCARSYLTSNRAQKPRQEIRAKGN
jgi:hypothetical protein